MLAVIAGDIINSRAKETKEWQAIVSEIHSQYSKTPSQWEIFRGDSFQIQLVTEKAFIAAIHIKAAVKQLFELDMGIAIGLAELDFQSKNVTTSIDTDLFIQELVSIILKSKRWRLSRTMHHLMNEHFSD